MLLRKFSEKAKKKQPAGNRFLAGCFACWRVVPMCGRLLKEGMKGEKWSGDVIGLCISFRSGYICLW